MLDTIYELLLVSPYSSRLFCHTKKYRFAHGVELFDDKVLIAGGQGGKTDVEIFDIRRNQCIRRRIQCIEMPPLPSPVSYMATVRRDDTMLLIGRGSEEGKCSNEIIQYDHKTGQSEVQLIMEKERVACSAVLQQNKLVMIGDTGKNEKAVDCFNF